MSDNAEVVTAYNRVINAIKHLPAEKQQRVLDAAYTLLGYQKPGELTLTTE